MELTGNSDKWRAFLRSMEFFSPFDDDELTAFLEAGTVKKISSHQYLIREGHVSTEIFIILQGRVSIMKENALKEKQQIGTLEKGEIVGEAASLLNHTRSASIIAITDTYVFAFSPKTLEELDDKTKAKFYRELSIFLSRKLISLTKSAAERMFGY